MITRMKPSGLRADFPWERSKPGFPPAIRKLLGSPRRVPGNLEFGEQGQVTHVPIGGNATLFQGSKHRAAGFGAM